MRRASLSFAILLLLAASAAAQIGKNPTIPAGSSEDKALAAINAASDPAQKLALLDQFVADYGKGDMALVAYDIYVSVYSGQKNYDKAFEYGEKMFAVDPDSFSTAVTLFRIAQEKNDLDRMFTYGERAQEIVTRFKSRPAPSDTPAAAWEMRKADALAQVHNNLNYISYTLLSLGAQQPDPMHRATLLERYATAFADSPYAQTAQSLVATSYQQAQDYAKMTEFAQKVLARDPSNLGMLLLLADDGSERGVDLDKAEEYAHRALDLLDKATKAEGLSDEQWQQQKSLQQGIAWTSIGQVEMQRKKNAPAVEAFRTAAPLLKSNAVSYARNQYRMGFALMNLKRTQEARAAFTEAASLDTPYRGPSQEKLASLTSGPAKHPAKKRP